VALDQAVSIHHFPST